MEQAPSVKVETRPASQDASWEAIPNAASTSMRAPQREPEASPAMDVDAAPANTAMDVDVTPAPMTTRAETVRIEVSPSVQRLRQNVHNTDDDFVLARDVASNWRQRNWALYLGAPDVCSGSRDCQRTRTAPSETGPHGNAPDSATNESRYHCNSDWYGALRGKRATPRAKAEREEAIRGKGLPLSSCCPPNLLDGRSTRSSSSLGNSVSADGKAVSTERPDPYDDRNEDDDADDADYVSPDDYEDATDEGESESEEEEYDDDDDEQEHTLVNQQDATEGPRYIIACSGYIPSQWLDVKPVWLQLRRFLQDEQPQILALGELIMLNKIHWLLHNIYHSCCVSNDVQDLFLDFLGLAPNDDSNASRPDADRAQCGPQDCLIVRAAHWMVPRELWTSLLLDLRAFAGNTVSLVCLNVDGIKNQAVGVGGLDAPQSAIFYFKACLRESLVLPAGEEQDVDGEDDDDDEGEAGADPQVIQSHLVLPCGEAAATRPSRPYSIKWASKGGEGRL